MTHDLGPERTYRILAAFRRRAAEIIRHRDGFIAQYVGDDVMAFFNAPLRRADYKARGVNASLELQRAMGDLSRELGESVAATVGVASGNARIGVALAVVSLLLVAVELVAHQWIH